MVEQPNLDGLEQTDLAAHMCASPGCRKWGGWGFDDGEGVREWWCLEHRPNVDPIKEAPLAKEPQDWISDGNEG